MSFKYINPGYAKLLDVVGNSSYLNQQAYDTNTSRTGASYKTYIYTYPNYIKFRTAHDTGDLWIKCDAFLNSSNYPYIRHLGEYRGTSSFYNGLYCDNSSSTVTYNFCFSGSVTNLVSFASYDENLESIVGLRRNAINTFLLHLHYGDSSSGYIELNINNKKNWKVAGSVTAIDTARIVIGSYNLPISSIIVSDEEINPNERVIALPVSNTITDFESLPSGIYTADTASEALLQSVNTTSLVNEYGSDAQVTGIALIGNPAYEVDDVIGSLTAITKQNGVVTDHDKITLLTDSDAMIVSSFALPTDTTVADLANYQFGWRAEE